MNTFFANMKKEKFDSTLEMLNILEGGTDLYNPVTGEYVFKYNEEGALAVYKLSNEEALKVSNEVKDEDGDYWGSHLGFGGQILEGDAVVDFIISARKGYYDYWVKTDDIDREVRKQAYGIENFDMKKAITPDNIINALDLGAWEYEHGYAGKDKMVFTNKSAGIAFSIDLPDEVKNAPSEEKVYGEIYEYLYSPEVSLKTFKDIATAFALAGVALDVNHYYSKEAAAVDLLAQVILKEPVPVTIGIDKERAIIYDDMNFPAKDILYNAGVKAGMEFFKKMGIRSDTKDTIFSEIADSVVKAGLQSFEKNVGIKLISATEVLAAQGEKYDRDAIIKKEHDRQAVYSFNGKEISEDDIER